MVNQRIAIPLFVIRILILITVKKAFVKKLKIKVSMDVDHLTKENCVDGKRNVHTTFVKKKKITPNTKIIAL